MRKTPFGLVLLAFALSAIGATPPSESDLIQQRAQFQAAWQASQRMPDKVWRKLAFGLERYPLYPYIELAALKRRLAQLKRAEVEDYLKAWPDSLPARDLRDAYLGRLAAAGQWKEFLALYREGKNRDLRCAELMARIKLGPAPDFTNEILPLWLSANALPSFCNDVFHWTQQHGSLNAALVWQRIELAAAAGNAEVITSVAAFLDNTEKEAAERIAQTLREPAATLAKADAWPDAPRNRDAMAFGLERLARHSSDAAETLWAKFNSHFHFTPEQRNRVLRALALYRATEYSSNALARLAALPAEAHDDATREWRVRVAVVAGDWEKTLEALEALSDTQKKDPRWRYLLARVLGKLGRDGQARPVFSALAREANFYGFLAADWLQEPYTICPLHLATDGAVQTELLALPGLTRAFEWFRIGNLSQARREWDYLLPQLTLEQRRLAAEAANSLGWHDRAPFTFTKGEELQLYELRFPLAQRAQIEQAAKQAGIDPAWAYAIIRAESAFMSDAHSTADAYGLMQLLPGTATQIAKAAKIAYTGISDLLKPDINIALGTRYLSEMAAHYHGSPWLASAAYNAGVDPVGRWIGARGTYEPDFFVETIPYKETREYVSRVLAFSVIYDWRLHGAALPLSSRMPRIGQAYTLPDEHIVRKSVVCPPAAQSTAVVTTPAGSP